MTSRILMLIAVGMLAGCAAPKAQDTSSYRSVGTAEKVQSSREQCVSSCNESYSTCMDSHAAQYGGVNGPSGMFGASADCRNDLQECLPKCKAR